MIYSNFQICPDLVPKQICFVLTRYSQGVITRIVHEHVPAHRISKGERINLLKTLIISSNRRLDDSLFNIIPYYLNGRGKNPARHLLRITCEYPEAGVLRFNCGDNVHAWCDCIINAEKFRPNHNIDSHII